jgi:hypothetical protein
MMAAVTADLFILRPTAMFLLRLARRAESWRDKQRVAGR